MPLAFWIRRKRAVCAPSGLPSRTDALFGCPASLHSLSLDLDIVFATSGYATRSSLGGHNHPRDLEIFGCFSRRAGGFRPVATSALHGGSVSFAIRKSASARGFCGVGGGGG